MKRRRFILATVAAVAAVTIPVVYYNFKNKHKSYPPLLMPEILEVFCDESVIREIGKSYRDHTKAEDNQTRLKELLLANGDQNISETNKKELTSFLEKKIIEDFRENRTVIEKGWIISKTEARQCALFSIINPI